ncbi:MAG: 1,6-anhydro-N-acetylmuramyl-L-alanine amidase AmpD, partial [Proteobacteria bacterium]|nr:1,6-anhydro-N-acetylmuramyl-L-alanine amidase AmpD [Pseudomonadota bacterium]
SPCPSPAESGRGETFPSSLPLAGERRRDGVSVAPSQENVRRVKSPLSLIVLHNISLPPGYFGGHDILKLFTNTLNPAAHPLYPALARLRVSAHFVVRRNGRLIQCVSCRQRAWHAGVSQWQGRPRCNDFSIGVELEGSDHTPYTARQYRSLNRLLDCLCRHYPITAIVGHSVIAPGRKTDPGPAFDPSRLEAAPFATVKTSA